MLLRYRLWAEPVQLRAGLACLASDLGRMGLDGDARIDAEIVLAEVLNNIAEHAYAGTGGRIDLALLRRPAESGLCCLIHDTGKPMPTAVLQRMSARSEAPVPDLGTLAEGGYGLALIAALAGRISHRRLRGRNLLRLCLPTAASSA